MPNSSHGYKTVSPEEVAALIAGRGDVLLLDVRTPAEFRSYRIPGATLLPVQDLSRRMTELDPERATICICEHGIRSESAAAFLAANDFDDVATMAGGMSRWAGEVERG